jgi:glycosyltransferase involved in cell wall biosynthesis
MKILTLTNMYPTDLVPEYGTVVQEQVESLRAIGLSVDVLKIGDGPAPGRHIGKYVRALPALLRTVAAVSPDVIHAHYGLSGAIAVLQRRAPVVTTFHGSDTGYVRWQARISWIVARRTTPIFVAADGAARLRISSPIIIPCGVDLNRFRPLNRAAARQALGWDDARRYVLLPGARSRPEKRADLFDAALALARQAVGDLVGVSLERTERAKVPLLMNAVDATLVTSDSEGSPVTVKESLACQTPVVSVPVGDVPRLIQDLPGCSVVPREPGALARAVGVALSTDRSPALRERVVPYDQRRIAEQIASVYDRVLANHER